MIVYRIANDGQLYLASLALGSIILCGSALLAVRLLRRQSPALRHGLLLSALLLCAISPVAIAAAQMLHWGWMLDLTVRVETPNKDSVPRVPRVAPQATPQSAEKTGRHESPEPSTFASHTTPENSATKATASAPAPAIMPKRELASVTRIATPVWPLLWAAVALAWFVGMFLSFFRLLRGSLVLRKLRRSLTEPTDDRVTGLMQASLARVGSQRRVRVCESRLAPAPLSCGVLRPVIVLPTELSRELDDTELELVLAHEVAHVARYDHAVALIERLVVVFFWWNVLLRRMNRRLSQLREQICDDYAAGEGEERRRLAEVLVKIAGWNAPGPLRIDGATALVDDARDDLTGRVTRLVNNWPRSMPLSPRAVLAVATFACSLGAVLLLATLRAAPIDRLEPTPEQRALIAELNKRGISVMENWSTNRFEATAGRSQSEFATDSDVARLVELGSIGSIDLSSERLTDACLEPVGRLGDLTKLTLQNFAVSAKGLAHLAKLPNLTELVIRASDLDDAGLAALKAIPHLSKLDIAGWNITDAGLAHLPEFPELEEFSIGSSRRRISADGVKSLARIPRLAGLSISSQTLVDDDLLSLPTASSLTSLHLQGPKFTDEALRTIAAIPNLVILNLQCPGISAAGIVHLKNCVNLDTLGFTNCPQLNDDSLRAVGELTALRKLSLGSDTLTDAGLAHLAGLVNLQSLSLQGDKFTGEGLKFLEPCQEIQDVYASGKLVGDEIFAPVSAFPRLRLLHIGNGPAADRMAGGSGRTRITDAGLTRLTSQSLEFAHFAGTGLTEACFESLEKLPNLRSASFPWTSGIKPPFWNRNQPRVARPRRATTLTPQVARLSRQPLNDESTAESDAARAALKEEFGPQAVAQTGMRNRTALWSIHLEGPKVTDQSIEKLKPLKNLDRVRVSGPNLTDAGVARLAELVDVRSIGIGGDQLTDACLTSLARMPRLKELGISAAPISGEGIARLAQLPALRSLSLALPYVADADLAPLATLEQIEALHLDLPRVTDAGLAHVARMPRLASFTVHRKQFTDAGVHELAGSKTLKDVSLWSEELTDAALADIAHLPNIEQIQLHSPRFTDEGLAHLQNAQGLKAVTLNCPLVTDVGLASLGTLVNMDHLSLANGQFTDDGLAALAGAVKLRSLTLENTQATGAGLKSLAGLQRLDSLTLTGPAVSDAAIVAMGEFPRLNRLRLGGVAEMPSENGITDEGLKRITACRGLHYLDLEFTRITNDGLAPLVELPVLAGVSFRKSPAVTYTGLAKLREVIPTISANLYTN